MQSVDRSLREQRVPHAWLVHGARGLGKGQFVQILAKRLLCTGESSEGPCERCASCTLYEAGSHPDFNGVVPLDGKTSISVDQIRSLSQALGLKSHQGARKVALVIPADAMTNNAANSLLKTLEEPAGDAVLLLVTDKPADLPRTIRSRCQGLSVATPKQAVALDWLQQQDPTTDWVMPLGLARGAPLLAMKWQAEGKFDVGRILLKDLIQLCAGKCSTAAVVSRWEKEGEWALIWLEAWSQDMVRTKFGVAEEGLVLREFATDLHDLSKNIKLRDIFNYLDELMVATAGYDGPANKQLTLESLLLPWQNELMTRRLRA